MTKFNPQSTFLPQCIREMSLSKVVTRKLLEHFHPNRPLIAVNYIGVDPVLCLMLRDTIAIPNMVFFNIIERMGDGSWRSVGCGPEYEIESLSSMGNAKGLMDDFFSGYCSCMVKVEDILGLKQVQENKVSVVMGDFEKYLQDKRILVIFDRTTAGDGIQQFSLNYASSTPSLSHVSSKPVKFPPHFFDYKVSEDGNSVTKFIQYKAGPERANPTRATEDGMIW